MLKNRILKSTTLYKADIHHGLLNVSL